MPEIVNVQPTDPITSEWGNKIRDRTVQRYTSATQRASLHASPAGGDLAYLADTGTVEVFHGAAWHGFLPVGALLPYAGPTAPAGFLLCNGAAVSRSTYAALFAVLGTAYGPGDGSTTFNVPDLRQRFPIGLAASGPASTRGAVGGLFDHTHTGPSHQHTPPVATDFTHSAHQHFGAAATAGGHAHANPGGTHNAGAHSHTVAASTSSAGAHTHTTGGASDGGPVNTSGVFERALVSHTHSTSSAGGHAHSFSTSSAGVGDHGHAMTDTASVVGHTHTVSTDNGGAHQHAITAPMGASGTGSSGPANPPYQVVLYIVKT